MAVVSCAIGRPTALKCEKRTIFVQAADADGDLGVLFERSRRVDTLVEPGVSFSHGVRSSLGHVLAGVVEEDLGTARLEDQLQHYVYIARDDLRASSGSQSG